MDIFTEAELAEMLEMPAVTVGELRQARELAAPPFGRSVRYTSEQIAEMVRTHAPVSNSNGVGED